MRRKHPKLPNGYGSIKKLSGKRRNPYAVYPPSKGLDEKGNPIMEPAICYTDDWYKGFAVLTAYKAGTYVKGMEVDLDISSGDAQSLSKLTTQMMQTYSQLTQNISGKSRSKTFAEVYELFYEDKYGGKNEGRYSESIKGQNSTAFRNCKPLHNREFDSLVTADLQSVVDNCTLGYGSLGKITSLYTQMYKYAMANNLCETDYSKYVKIKTDDDTESGVPFTDNELKILWANKDDETIRIALIMCYSGHRISELKAAIIDLEKMLFIGGIKNDTSKARVVPIHSAIQPLVKRQIELYGCILPCSTNTYRVHFYSKLEALGIKSHKPHDCRRTFSTQANNAKLDLFDIKRLMGHKIDDITQRVYIKRTPEELRTEIEKIKAPE